MNPANGRIAQAKIEMTSHCPKCGYGPLEGLSEVNLGSHGEIEELKGQRPDPKPGDVTMCADCGEMLVFTLAPNGRLAIEKAPPHVIEQLKKDEETWKLYNHLTRTHSPRRYPKDGRLVRFSALFRPSTS